MSTSCPFCGFADEIYEVVALHIEELHTDDSPFVIQAASAASASTLKELPPSPPNGSYDDDSEQYVLCPEKDCGEELLLFELNEHLDLHESDKLTFAGDTSQPHSIQQSFSTDLPDALRHKKYKGKKHSLENEKHSLARSIFTAGSTSSKSKEKSRRGDMSGVRLGRKELGPHAYEERMPDWLYKQLQSPVIVRTKQIGADGRLVIREQVENEFEGVIPVLAHLCALDKSVQEVYLCHPATLYIGKAPNESGFCGYRNIQMFLSYIIRAKAKGYRHFGKHTPTILNIQDIIEDAWDRGIDPISRVQTGGIRGTRKYIGTPEARALCINLNIAHQTHSFHDSPEGREAHNFLLDAVEAYFCAGSSSSNEEPETHIHKTPLPPVYLQQPGHSITIVGFEKRTNGSRDLLVFDPQYRPSRSIQKLVQKISSKHAQPVHLEAFRRTPHKLRKFKNFEALTLTDDPPVHTAWGGKIKEPDSPSSASKTSLKTKSSSSSLEEQDEVSDESDD